MPRHFLRYDAGSGPRWAEKTGTGFQPLAGEYPTTGELIEAVCAQTVMVDPNAAPVSEDAVTILSPITRNQQLVAQATNYRSHVREVGIDPDTITSNVFFGKADGQWYRPPSYYELWWRGTWAREGGGAATGQGIHILDQTLWILGKRPAQVIGKIGTFVHPVPRARAEGRVPIEDTALGVVTFEDGSRLASWDAAALPIASSQGSAIETPRPRRSVRREIGRVMVDPFRVLT